MSSVGCWEPESLFSVLLLLPGSTPQLHHLVRCLAREAPGSPFQFSNAALAASAAAATSSACAWRQVAKFSPGETEGGEPRLKRGETVSEQRGAKIPGDWERAVKLVPALLRVSGLSSDKWG